jgi:hypothetical protein
VRGFILSFLLTIAISTHLLAHSNGHGEGSTTKWSLTSGEHVWGSFHSAHGGWVIIEQRSGSLKAIPIDQFSPQDQKHLLNRIKQIASINVPSTAADLAVLRQPMPATDYSAELAIIGVAVLVGTVLGTRRTLLRVTGVSGSFLMLFLAASPGTTARIVEILGPTVPESIDSTFAAYKPWVKTRWDANYFYVESNGMPTAMPAMKGITAWQQQVPIPQPYTGANAWSIPLNPVIADVPVSLDTALHTGAVAIAINGVPVFNPENNRGEFSQDIGELDAFGGHCGRADDYHYHIAPVHLTPKGQRKTPIAWALDGYKLYGYEEPDGTVATNLDQHLGHIWNGEYHYHAIDRKPYMIASMRGKVTIQNDQVVPQPRAAGVRTYLQALRGATITDLRQCDANHFALRYEVNGKTCFVNYRWDSTGKNFVFNFIKTDSTRTTFNYTRK